MRTLAWKGRGEIFGPRGRLRLTGLALLVCVCGVSGCVGDTEEGGEIAPPVAEGPEQPIRITGVELGRSIDAEMRVDDGLATDEFASGDTIFASVNTDGTLGNAIVTARWLGPNGEVINEAARAISPTRATVLAFQVSDPEGFAPGRYTLTILLGGVGVETREFSIR